VFLFRNWEPGADLKIDENNFLSFLDGLIDVATSTPELFVECALYIDGVLFGLPTRTRHGIFLESKSLDNRINPEFSLVDLCFARV